MPALSSTSMTFTLLLLTISSVTVAQTEKQTDSLISVMCNSLQKNRQLRDSTKLLLVYGKHIFPFVEQYAEDDRERITENIYYRFQRKCVDFGDLLVRLNPSDPYWNYWEKVENKPKTTLTKSSCKDFVNHKFIYSGSSGDTVNMVIEKGYWIDNFHDGSHTKLKFAWISDCEFELEFIESSNSVQKQSSKKGDKYRYQVIDKKDKYYVVSVEVVGTDAYHLTYLFF